jgi:predicted glycosyltransferase involved in capsule biosynthesis
LILHDVDLIPENDGNFYTCETTHPKHTTVRVRPVLSKQSYTRYYEFLIGGVLLLTIDMYKKVNGFSNSYWGWGGEDDDLSLRLIERQMCVVRPTYDIATYAGKRSSIYIIMIKFFFEFSITTSSWSTK